MRKAAKFIPAIATFLIGGGLQLSGIQIPWLGYGLMIAGVLLFVIPAWSYIRRLRFQNPIVFNKLKENHQVQPLSSEERELLDFYERQKENWRSYIRLQIVHVVPRVTGDAPPKVIFELEARNYLPIKFKLVKVTHSSGKVNAGELGYRELPALPETIDEEVGACTERRFKIELAVHGTDIPRFLQSVSEAGQLLQWTLKGEWYVEIYGKTEVWQYQSYEMMYDQVIVRSQVIQRRGL